jgi:hypothetical protein
MLGIQRLEELQSDAEKICEEVVKSIWQMGKMPSEISGRGLLKICCDICNYDIDQLSEDKEESIKFYCNSIHGTCYYLGLSAGFSTAETEIEQAKYCSFVDYYLRLYAGCFCTRSEKEKYFAKLQLFPSYIKHPEWFSQ